MNIIVLYCYITLNVINKFNCFSNKNFRCNKIFRIAKILNGTFIKEYLFHINILLEKSYLAKVRWTNVMEFRILSQLILIIDNLL